MSQSSLTIANNSGYNFRMALNAALAALGSVYKGSDDPATSGYAINCLFWADTGNSLFKQRSSDNTSWITKGTLDNDDTVVWYPTFNNITFSGDFHDQTTQGTFITSTINQTNAPNTTDKFWLYVVVSGTNILQMATSITTGLQYIEYYNGTSWDSWNTTLTIAGGALSGALNEISATLASASTVNIGAASGNIINITGSTTITVFDTVQAGTRRTLRFEEPLTISYSTSMLTPSNQDLYVSAGDAVECISLGSGVWAVYYQQGVVLSGRNKIINGDMSIDQRNSGAAQTITAAAAKAYTVDRWYAYCTGANVTGQRVTSGTNGFQYAYQFTGATSNTGIQFGQRIEAANSYDLAGNTCTLQAQISSSTLTSVTWTAYYATTADTFGTIASPTRTQIAAGTFTITSTQTKYSTNISIPSAATTGIEIVFSVSALTSGTLSITGVQLEKGSVATPFKFMNYEDVLRRCQRYYIKVYPVSGTYNMFGTGWTTTTTNGSVLVPLPTTMRTTPSLSYGSLSYLQVSGYAVSSITAMYLSDYAPNGARIDCTCSNLTAGQVATLEAINNTSAWIAFSSEL